MYAFNKADAVHTVSHSDYFYILCIHMLWLGLWQCDDLVSKFVSFNANSKSKGGIHYADFSSVELCRGG